VVVTGGRRRDRHHRVVTSVAGNFGNTGRCLLGLDSDRDSGKLTPLGPRTDPGAGRRFAEDRDRARRSAPVTFPVTRNRFALRTGDPGG
jgi:hypothetical protein